MLLTGPFGGLTDDVREFLRCLDGDGLLLTGWGELDPASLRTVRERLPGGGAGGDGPDGLALARRRTTLLRSLCDAGRLTEADAGEWRQALWSTALAPLAMLGALDLPARMSPSPALLAAAAAMSGPEPPPSLASATANEGPAGGGRHVRLPGAGARATVPTEVIVIVGW